MSSHLGQRPQHSASAPTLRRSDAPTLRRRTFLHDKNVRRRSRRHAGGVGAPPAVLRERRWPSSEDSGRAAGGRTDALVLLVSRLRHLVPSQPRPPCCHAASSPPCDVITVHPSCHPITVVAMSVVSAVVGIKVHECHQYINIVM